jgi:hypothetical protein
VIARGEYLYEFLHTLPPSDGPAGDPEVRKP